MNRFLLAGGLAVAAALGAVVWLVAEKPGAPAEQPPVATSGALPAFVGSDACAGCHPQEHAAWLGSQHAVAMLEATPASVLGDFDEARFAGEGITASFHRQGENFVVRTQGVDGEPAEFAIRYTFGVYPLQQYLVEFPRGRLQSLTVAWDARPAEAGGQRWFNLYPGQRIAPGSPLHWTGIDQNWNYQCADCHSTDLRKNFDEAADSFATRWSEINVACEACHGPGEAHVGWARAAPRDRGPGTGLIARLDERRGVGWTIDAASGTPRRSTPRTTTREIEVCARCHARRGQFSDDHVAGQPLQDAFRPALLEPGLYWPDGQMRDEVYNYGSFLTSRMAAKGVTCSDCHEPHAMTLRAPGNAVCSQCHPAATFDAPAHHHHAGGSAGAQCAACHMPTTTYMVVDPRHDHSFRIPRPDRSVALGVPDACTACHRDRAAQWAADAVRSWFPNPKPGFQDFAETFAAADGGDGRARPSLVALAEDPTQPAIVRASALARLAGDPRPDMMTAVQRGLVDGDPMLRVAAADALAGTDPARQAQLLAPLLADPIRSVRMSAARSLAGAGEATLEGGARTEFEAALAEYIAAQRFNADRPEAQANLGSLLGLRGDPVGAEAAYRKSLALDPMFVPAWVNLADLQRLNGDEPGAETTLREGLKHSPGDAALRHALGLSLVRSGNMAAALPELEAAAAAAPGSARYAYVHAIALHSAGREQAAIRALERALERHPVNRDMMLALASIHLDAGRRDEALQVLAKLAEAYPGDPEVAQLLRSMR